MKLRDYQQETVDAIWRSSRGRVHDRPVCPVGCVPTGGGKSIIGAEIIRQVVEQWNGQVVSLAHRKELLVQNRDELLEYSPSIQAGIYSAGLNKREVEYPIVFGGIQSIYKHALKLGRREVVLVDECHMLDPKSETTMYGRFLKDLRIANPNMIVIGLSATPYRTSFGCITDGEVFDEIAHTVNVQDLISRGFLCGLVNTPTSNAVSMEGVGTRNGDFIQRDAEDRFLRGDNVQNAVQEIIAKSVERKSILVFCAGVLHAERVAGELVDLTGDDNVRLVTGETPPIERQASLEGFKSGKFRFLVNVSVLTTGFNARCIDCIAVLRATRSAGLFAQICGRGFRTHESKSDTLVLDFGGNLERHGPLDSPSYGKVVRPTRESDNGESSTGEPMKECPTCEEWCNASLEVCPNCGVPFPPKHDEKADETSPILAVPKEFTVESIDVEVHTKRLDPDAPKTMRIDYRCTDLVSNDGPTISEWVCIEHEGYAFEKAAFWWNTRSLANTPETAAEAVSLWKRGACRNPVKITAFRDGQFWKIESCEFEDKIPEKWQPAEGWNSCTLDPFENEIPF